MIAAAPLCAAVLAGFWEGVAGLASGSLLPVQTQSHEAGVWLAEIGAARDASGSGPAPVSLLALGMVPLGAPDRPADLASANATIRVGSADAVIVSGQIPVRR